MAVACITARQNRRYTGDYMTRLAAMQAICQRLPSIGGVWKDKWNVPMTMCTPGYINFHCLKSTERCMLRKQKPLIAQNYTRAAQAPTQVIFILYPDLENYVTLSLNTAYSTRCAIQGHRTYPLWL